MQSLTFIDINNLDFEDIQVDPYWNVSEKKENSMHKIHAYPAKFPSFITTKALAYAEKKNLKVDYIGDIFCGCGTVAYEAAKENIKFWGCDINPVATLIARTKSRRYDLKLIESLYEEIVNIYTITQSIKIAPINERINYWFVPEQINDLYKLKEAILTVVNEDIYKDFFLCAFSNILKPTSKWLTKSIKPQIDPQKRIENVLTRFGLQITKMKKANEENEIIDNTLVTVETENILLKKIEKPFLNFIVTSPPYVTSYEYADLHQLSSLWLEYVDDYKDLREGTIGSLYHQTNFEEDIQSLNNTAKAIVNKLCIANKSKAKSAARYFSDMQKSITKSYSLLKRGGYSLFVIGNTEYKGVRIDNAKHLAESMFDAGYTNLEISKRNISGKILTPYRDKNGRFTKSNSHKKVYSEEFIIIGQKL